MTVQPSLPSIKGAAPLLLRGETTQGREAGKKKQIMEEHIVTKAIYAITEYRRNGDKKNRWTRVGTAFENRDGSWNLKLEFTPTDPKARLQLREPFENGSNEADTEAA